MARGVLHGQFGGVHIIGGTDSYETFKNAMPLEWRKFIEIRVKVGGNGERGVR